MAIFKKEVYENPTEMLRLIAEEKRRAIERGDLPTIQFLKMLATDINYFKKSV